MGANMETEIGKDIGMGANMETEIGKALGIRVYGLVLRLGARP